MAFVNEFGRRITIIEGNEAEINEIRAKLNELGIDIINTQFLELKNKDLNTKTPSSQPQVNNKIETAPTSNENSENEALNKYNIQKAGDNYKIPIYDSDIEKIKEFFGKKKRKAIKEEGTQSNFFFVLCNQFVEYSLFPNNNKSTNENHLTALKMLNLV